jgi:hypothetical protein
LADKSLQQIDLYTIKASGVVKFSLLDELNQPQGGFDES